MTVVNPVNRTIVNVYVDAKGRKPTNGDIARQLRDLGVTRNQVAGALWRAGIRRKPR